MQRSIRSVRLEWSQVRVGAFLIVALAILAYAVYRVGDLFDVFADRYTIVTLVSRADGLLEGAPVTLAGQRVGQVEAIEFLPVDTRPENLSIQLSINDDIREHVRADSYAQVRTQGLLGDRYVDIAPGSPAQPIVEPWDTIRGVDPVDTEELLAAANTTLIEMQALVADLRSITRSLLDGQGTLGRLLVDDALYLQMTGAASQLEALIVDINTSDGTIARLIRDPLLYQQLVGAVARVDTLTGLALSGQGTLGRLLRDDTVYEGLLGVIGRADTTIAGFGGALRALTAGDGTLQRLLRDPALYDQLLKAVIDLQILIADIRQDPSRIRPEINVDIF
ncbi:MAG TPA: MlaD family protein [Longimicrobiales bacterium]